MSGQVDVCECSEPLCRLKRREVTLDELLDEGHFPVQEDKTVVGFVEADSETGQYSYWCVQCVPSRLRQTHREIYSTDLEAEDCTCISCDKALINTVTS